MGLRLGRTAAQFLPLGIAEECARGHGGDDLIPEPADKFQLLIETQPIQSQRFQTDCHSGASSILAHMLTRGPLPLYYADEEDRPTSRKRRRRTFAGASGSWELA